MVLIKSIISLAMTLVIILFVYQPSALADLPESQPIEHPHELDSAAKPQVDKSLIDQAQLRSPTRHFSWAAGVAPLWVFRSDYGAHSFRRFEPEFVGFIYQKWPGSNLPSRFWLRHGLRLGYSNDQPQMPKAMRLEESDAKLAVEEGLLWNSFIVPSLTAGIGYDWRTIRIKTRDPVMGSDRRLNTKDSFLWSYIQAGVGIPIMNGTYLIEPVLRRHHLTHDKRSQWAIGLELTAGY
jgi:hypothetical protein